MALKFDGLLWTWGKAIDEKSGVKTSDVWSDSLISYLVDSPKEIMISVKYVDNHAIKLDDTLWDLISDMRNPKKIMDDVKFVVDGNDSYENSESFWGKNYSVSNYYIRYNGELWRFSGESFEKIMGSGQSNPPINPVEGKIFICASSWSLTDLRDA